MYTCTIHYMKSVVNMNQSTVTRDMVASEAKVSSATVSRVYNNPDSVSAERRDAVLSAAKRLGYVPNKSASALRRKGTGIITLVEFDKGNRPYYWNDMPLFNWFYGDVIKGTKETIDKSMYHLNLATVSNQKELQQLQDSSDALLFFDVDDQSEVEMVEEVRIPYVAAHHTNIYSGLWSCSTDNRFGGRLQADELSRKQVRRPLYLTSHLKSVVPHTERLAGFLERWKELSSIDPMVIEIESREHEFDQMLEEVEGAPVSTCDGIAAVNDILMLRVLNRIPIRPMPLVGYDANPMRDIIPYHLSSIDIRQKEIYKRAAQMLIERLNTPISDESPCQEIIPPVIVHG